MPLAESGKNVLSSAHVRSPGSILAEQVKSFPVAVLACLPDFAGKPARCSRRSPSRQWWASKQRSAIQRDACRARLASLETERAPGPACCATGRCARSRQRHRSPGDSSTMQRGMWCQPMRARHSGRRTFRKRSRVDGESLPVSKTVEPSPAGSACRAHQHGLPRQPDVTGASGSAIVDATGVHTEVGRVQRLVAISRPPQTTQCKRQHRRARAATRLDDGPRHAGLFVIGVIRGQSVFTMVVTALSLAVAAIPEGLPMIATTSLAVGVERIARRGMVVRRINAV